MEGVLVFREFVCLDGTDTMKYREHAWRGAPIFNPDKRRVQAALPPADPVVQRLEAALRQRGLLYGRTMGTAVVLHSYRGCRQQPWHTDYDPQLVEGLRKKPLGVLLALEDGTRLCVSGHDDVQLQRGDTLVFEGDVVHAGAPYEDRPNTRIHVYLPSACSPQPDNETYTLGS